MSDCQPCCVLSAVLCSVSRAVCILDRATCSQRLTCRTVIIGAIVAVIVIIIVVAVVVSKKNADTSGTKTGGLDSISPGSIPAGAPSWLDPYQWQDTTDFNLTYTNDTVGGLPVMGLFTAWE